MSPSDRQAVTRHHTAGKTRWVEQGTCFCRSNKPSQTPVSSNGPSPTPTPTHRLPELHEPCASSVTCCALTIRRPSPGDRGVSCTLRAWQHVPSGPGTLFAGKRARCRNPSGPGAPRSPSQQPVTGGRGGTYDGPTNTRRRSIAGVGEPSVSCQPTEP
ncbi:hypothetical protein CC85DRAFT_57187 [Cutaneotrichosporon oleaginosum]|uniref:Uncharacterized protein n=1 Tax=Cutaneotrichosporon oleaginosum TaxID=879819 RepID=A0A0J0XYV2_9TREE|nr:uncharacterized protein CC85DRAFT_57187 [Cutaneotrichosporon oleaginosum]KLT46206.1 hypothetical protein CC85DRAFT_57187 [Cutaneotrichosporon oleaginosum]TXT10213.1 hypothetical protein COLE_04147 [Cutaneotrichosporon oleaginosum]